MGTTKLHLSLQIDYGLYNLKSWPLSSVLDRLKKVIGRWTGTIKPMRLHCPRHAKQCRLCGPMRTMIVKRWIMTTVMLQYTHFLWSMGWYDMHVMGQSVCSVDSIGEATCRQCEGAWCIRQAMVKLWRNAGERRSPSVFGGGMLIP